MCLSAVSLPSLINYSRHRVRVSARDARARLLTDQSVELGALAGPGTSVCLRKSSIMDPSPRPRPRPLNKLPFNRQTLIRNHRFEGEEAEKGERPGVFGVDVG